MKVLISHPTGNAFFRAAAEGLLDAGMLGGLYTTVATFPGNIFDRMGYFRSFVDFNRRQYDPALRPFTETSPWLELGRMAAAKAGFKKLTRNETAIFSIDAVYQSLDRRVASSLKHNVKQGLNAVYAYEDGALHTFTAAKQMGLLCLYDLPIGYWRAAQRLLEIEKERWPDWLPTLIGFGNSETKLARKDEELHLADCVFVASSFTAATLNEYPSKLPPVKVIPYAFPPIYKEREYSSIRGRSLKLLFVGGLSQRKGIADLFAAIKPLGKRVELTVVGLKMGDNCKALDEALAQHKWIPSLPHNEVLKLMRQHDVLVFPSLFEGFGLVITEAMSQGMPVITTERTAGPDLIKSGENGWLIEAGSTGALRLAIEDILTKPDSIIQAGRLALEQASKRTWEVYRQELTRAILAI
jgi:glycosyltransferase involved in cell wall biosynthesis